MSAEWDRVHVLLTALPIGESVTVHGRTWKRHSEHWLADERGALFDAAAATNVTVH